MEVITLEEFVTSGRVYVLLGAILVVGFVIRWYINAASGANYYERYPTAKAMDELAASGELKDKDIMSALRNIDCTTPKNEQTNQFK